MKAISKSINSLLGTISQTKLFGWLPLDIVLHFLLGALIMIVIQVTRKSATQAFFGCLLFALIKEAYDSQSLVASWSEAIKDLIITMIYPSLVMMIIFIKKKLDRER